MNKIFKVLWSKSRGCWVAVDENRTSSPSGKVKTKAVSAVLGLSVLFASQAIEASNISAGWDSTKVHQNGQKWEVHTNHHVNGVGVNKFNQFEVSKGDLTNLHFGSSDKLLNFVNSTIKVDGTVNGVLNNKIGGDLYFVTPSGMTIGKTGVINAGSLTATVVTDKQFKTWWESVDKKSDLVNDNFLKNLATGDEIALNPKGVISVNGSINAGNRVALLAGGIEVGETGRIRAGVDDFKDLVNITDSTGRSTVSAGLAKDQLSLKKDEATGDILLFARAEGDLVDKPKADQVVNGNLVPVKVAATVKVAKGASVKAKKDVVIQALAGNSSYKQGEFRASTGAGMDVSARVDLEGHVEAGGRLDVDAKAVNKISHVTAFNIATLTEQFESGFSPFNKGTVEYVDMATTAIVNVGQHAELQGREGVSLESKAVSDLVIGDSTGWKNYINWGKLDYIPVVATAIARAHANSEVNVAGTVKSGGDLKLRAEGVMKAQIATQATEHGTKEPQASVIYADIKSASKVKVAESAVLSAIEGGKLGDVTIEADQTNSVVTKADTFASNATNMTFAFNVTKFDSSADVDMLKGLESLAKTVTINSKNVTERLRASTIANVGDFSAIVKIQGKLDDIMFSKIAEYAEKLGFQMGGSMTQANFQLGGAFTYVNNSQSADVRLAKGDYRSQGDMAIKAESALVDHIYGAASKQILDGKEGNSQVEQQGTVAILINTTDRQSTAAHLTVADGVRLESAEGNLSLSAAATIDKERVKHVVNDFVAGYEDFFTYFNRDHYKDHLYDFEEAKNEMLDAFAVIDNGQGTKEQLQRLAEAMQKMSGILETMIKLASESLTMSEDVVGLMLSQLKVINPLQYTNAYVNAGGRSGATTTRPLSGAGSFGVLNQTAQGAVSIAGSAALKAGQSLDVVSETRNENIAVGGLVDNFFGIPLPQHDKGTALGVTTLYQSLRTDNQVKVAGAADIFAKNTLNMAVRDAIEGFAITAGLGTNSGGLTGNGLVSIGRYQGSNRLLVDDDAVLTAQNGRLNLSAERNDMLQAISATMTMIDGGGESSGLVGVGVAVNLSDLDNRVVVENQTEDDKEDGRVTGVLSAQKEVSATADSRLMMNAVGAAGQAASATGSGAQATQPDSGSMLGDLANDLSSGVAGDVGALRDSQGLFGAFGGAIAEGAGHALSQTGNASGGDGQYGALQNSSPSNQLDTSVSAAQGQTAAKNAFNFSAAGSIAVNDLDQQNIVKLETKGSDGSKLRVDADRLTVEAVTDKFIGAFAGAGSVNVLQQTGMSQSTVGIGGAGAGNRVGADNSVTIKGLDLSSRTRDVNIASLVDGTTVAQGLGMTLSKGGTNAVGIDAGISVNLVKNDVGARVEDIESANDRGDLTYQQVAWTGETQVTGGTALGVAGASGGTSVAAGAAVAVSDIHNTVNATLNRANFKKADLVDVHALVSLTQVNTAVGAQAAFGGAQGGSLNGSIVSATLRNDVTADVGHSNIHLNNQGDLSILAQAVGTAKGEAAHGYDQRAEGVIAPLGDEALLSSEVLDGVSIKTDEKGQEKDVKGLLASADMVQVNVALSGAGSSGRGGALGGAVIVTDTDNHFSANTHHLNVKHDGSAEVRQEATSGVVTANVAGGVAATRGEIGATGSVIVSNVVQSAKTHADHVTLVGDKGEYVMGAHNHALALSVGGNVSAQTAGSGGALGATVVVNQVTNEADVSVNNLKVDKSEGGTLHIEAHNDAQAWAAAASGAVAGNVALDGSVAVNRVVSNARVKATALDLGTLKSLETSARDTSEVWTLSGAVGAALKPGASVAGALAFASTSGETAVSLERVHVDGETNVSANAEAGDHVYTMALGGAGASTAAFSGSVAKNDVRRSVKAALTDMSTGVGPAGALLVHALGNMSIKNLGLSATGAKYVAGGIGVSSNTVDADVAAVAERLHGSWRTVDIAALSRSDVLSIGVGGALAGGYGAYGSTSVNRVMGDVTANLRDSVMTVGGASAVRASADDVLATYAGQAAGAGSMALGLSVTQQERTGLAQALVSDVSLTQSGVSKEKIDYQGGVSDDAILDGIVDQEALDAQTGLGDQRLSTSTDGILVSATNTTTYKSFSLNGSGAGGVAVAGAVNNVSHAGVTEAKVEQSMLTGAAGSGDGVEIVAQNAMNVGAVLATAGGALQASGNLAVSNITNQSQTRAEVADSSVSGTRVAVDAEAKSGVSSLNMALGGAGGIAVDATATVTRLANTVATVVDSTNLKARDVHIEANALNRLHHIGVSGAGTTGVIAGALNVGHHTVTTDALTAVRDSSVAAQGQVTVNADRRTDLHQYGAAASGALQGGAASGLVGINHLSGQATVEVDQSQVGGEQTDLVDMSAKSDDRIHIEAGSGSLGMWAGVGASVVVNQLTSASRIDLRNSAIKSDAVSVEALNDRTVRGTVAMASGALGAGVGANIVSTVIGGPAQALDRVVDSIEAGTRNTVLAMDDRFGAESSQDWTVLAVGDVVKAPEANSASALGAIGATTVSISNTQIDADKDLTIRAKEDATPGAGVNLTLGSGNLGSLSLAGSDARLVRNHGSMVNLQGGRLVSHDVEIESSVAAKDHIDVYQGTVGLATGHAALVETTSKGDVGLTIGDGVKMTTDHLEASARNVSNTAVKAAGLTVAGVGAGAMIAKAVDQSNVSLKMVDGVVKGLTQPNEGVVKLTVDRGQSLSAKAYAGYGGALTGVGARAEVFDTGVAKAEVLRMNISTGEVDVGVNLHPHMSVEAGSAGGSLGLAVGVVQGEVTSAGKAELIVRDSKLSADEVALKAHAGLNTDEANDAMRLDGKVHGYGGSPIHAQINTLKLKNLAHSVVDIIDNTFDGQTRLDVGAGGHAEYSAKAEAMHGGLVSAGSNHVDVLHGQTSAMTLSAKEAALKSLTARVQNSENVRAIVESAGGAVLGVQGDDAASIYHEDDSTASLKIDGQWHADEDIQLSSVTQADVKLTADNTKGGLGVFSGAYVKNSFKDRATEVVVGRDSSLSAGRDIKLQALTDWSLGAAKGDHMVMGDVYGAIAGNGIGLSNQYERDSQVVVEEGAEVVANHALMAQGRSTGSVDARVLARTAGAFNALGASIDSVIHADNAVKISEGSRLVTRDPSGSIVLAASGEDNLRHDAITRVEGAALANADSRVKVDYARSDLVGLSQGSKVLSGGELRLNAGASAVGDASSLQMKNRSEAFSYAFISGINAGLDVKTNLSGVVDVAGSATSTTNTDVIADSGDWTVAGDSLTHYWGQINKNDKSTVAIKGAGQKNTGVTETGRLNVTGKLEAGVNTKADIVIDGLLNPTESGAQIVGSTNRPNVTIDAGSNEAESDIREAISGPLTDAQNNVYWQRYEELGRLIQEYAGLSDKDSSSALVAYKAERKALYDLMKNKGWIDAQGRLLASDSALFIKVDGVTVSGGNIRLKTQKVEGDGRIAANAAEGISIDNRTNASLQVGNIAILEKGGSIELNGVESGAEGIKAMGFTGEAKAAHTMGEPTIDIRSSSTTGDYKVVYADGTSAQIKPRTGVVVTGAIENRAGDVRIDAQGDLLSLDNVSASGTLSMKAGGSITQSYAPGVTHIGGDVAGDWKTEIDRISSDENYRDQVTGSVSSNKALSTESSSKWVAGGAVIISGDLLNLNGVVQSGYSQYEINLSESELQTRIDAIKAAWKAAGSPVGTDVKQPMYQIQAEKPVKTADGSYKLQIACWYDPVKDRIVLDDVRPEGGSVFISGKVASTGNGQIFAADGAADVRLDAKHWDVLTGQIDTGTATGKVQIHDQFFADASKNIGGRVTEYVNGHATQYLIDQKGEVIAGTHKSVDANFYDPKKDLLYVWTEGKKTTEHYEFYKEWIKYWWGLSGSHLQEAHSNGKWTTVQDQSLTSGGTITDTLTRPDGASNDKFYAWLTKVSEYDTGMIDEIKRWNSGFLGFHKHESIHTTQDKGNTSVVTYTVKADDRVGVKFLKGSNTVDIRSGKNVYLGGDISAQKGSIAVKADSGSIVAHKSGVALKGADRVSLEASGSIGSANDAIRIVGGTGRLTLDATAGKSLHLDATSLDASRDVHAGVLSAGDALSVSTTGTLVVDQVRGSDLSFNSLRGDLTIKDLVQTEKLDHSQRLDVTAAGDVSVTATQGDVGLGLVESKAGNVTLSVTQGSLYDAQNHDESDALSAQDRLDAWVSAGVLNVDGSSLGLEQWKADVEAQTQAVKAEYQRLENYLLAQKSGQVLTETQLADMSELKARYSGCDSADEAISKQLADTTTTLAKVVASKANYGWTADELMHSIASTIINGAGSDVQGAKPTNIKGQNVSIEVASGVGALGHTVTGSLSSDNPNRLEVLKALAQADVGDFTSRDGVVSVTLKKPVTIDASGILNVHAKDNVYIASSDKEDLNIGSVVSNEGDVRLLAQNGIYAAAGGKTGLVSGSTVTLRGGLGGIGAKDNFINIHTDATDGWTAVSAGDDIFIKAVDKNGQLGDMTLYALSGDQHVTLHAGNLYAYAGDHLGQGYEDFSKLGYIHGHSLSFNVSGDLGTAETALRVGSGSNVDFSDTVKNVYLHAVGDDGRFELTGINASGVVDVKADADLLLERVSGQRVTVKSNNALAITNVTARSLLADAAGSAQIHNVSVDDEVILSTGSTLKVTDVTARDLLLNAETGAELSGRVEANNQLSLQASNGDIVASGSTLRGDNGVKLSAGHHLLLEGSSVEAGGSVLLEGTHGIDGREMDLRVTQAGTSLEAHSMLGDVNLTGGTLKTTQPMGGLTIQSGKNVLLSNFLASTPLAVGNLELRAKDQLALGTTPIDIKSMADILVEAQEIEGQGFETGTRLHADGSLSLVSNSKIDVKSGSLLEGRDVMIASGDAVNVLNSTIAAREGLSIAAKGGDLALVGNTQLTANSVDLIAAGNLTQAFSKDSQASVGTEALSAKAGGTLKLDAKENRFALANIDAGKDISVGSRDRETVLNINQQHGGLIDGSLKVLGFNNGFVFNNDLKINADALIHAEKVHAQALSARGALEVSDTQHNASAGGGVSFDGHVSGSSVKIFTTGGDTRLNKGVTATEGSIDVYRNATSAGVVHIASGQSAKTLTLLNTFGNVDAGKLEAVGTVFAVAGRGGHVLGRENFNSLYGKAGVSFGAENLSHLMGKPNQMALIASELSKGMLNAMNFEQTMFEASDTSRLSLPLVTGFMTPNGFDSAPTLEHLKLKIQMPKEFVTDLRSNMTKEIDGLELVEGE